MHWFGYSVFVTEFFRAMKIVSCFAGASWFLLTLKRIKQTLVPLPVVFQQLNFTLSC